MSLGEKMFEYRARHRLSMRAFAEKCGLSLQTVWSVEAGLQNPTQMTQRKIELVIEGEETDDDSKHK